MAGLKLCTTTESQRVRSGCGERSHRAPRRFPCDGTACWSDLLQVSVGYEPLRFLLVMDLKTAETSPGLGRQRVQLL